MAKIAFLGLGVMGYPMAGHLLKKGGHQVTVYNRNAAKAAAWVKEYGGHSAATPREAAHGCDYVLMCVGNDNDVRSVVWRTRRARGHEQRCNTHRSHHRQCDPRA